MLLRLDLRGFLHDPVDQAVVQRFLRSEELVALGIELHLRHVLARVLGDEFIQKIFGLDDVVGVDGDVRRLSFRAPKGLVDHNF